MDDEAGSPNETGPIDLQLHKMARELEAYMGGLFGIERRDIEQAIRRLQAGETPTQSRRLPDPVERGVILLDAFSELTRARLEKQDYTSVAALMELLGHTRENLERLIQEDK